MKIIGIGGSNHDFSAALLEDGVLTYAIEDERLDRVKHGSRKWDNRPGMRSFEYCLDAAGINIENLDGIYANIDLVESPGSPVSESLPVKVGHHLCHATAAFATAPIEQATLLVIDGHGAALNRSETNINLETVSIGKANLNELSFRNATSGNRFLSSTSWQYYCENSLGVFYKIVTDALGFGTRGQGKTMGLAPYGCDCFVESMNDFIGVTDEGRIRFDPYSGISDWMTDILKESKNPFQVRADLAYAAQAIFENALLKIAYHSHKVYRTSNLCYGGGCALNGAANYRLQKEGPFEKIFSFPASGDNGLSIGAAYYGHFEKLGIFPDKPSEIEYPKCAYLGRSYDSEEIEEACLNSSVSYRKAGDSVRELVCRLGDGEVVALFRGSSEIGPRALGHRSLLAPANSVRVRDEINLAIKARESFRPLAPMVLEEDLESYFELDHPSPFMLSIAKVRTQYREGLAGVCHVDGTARVQTISSTYEPFLAELLREYNRVTGLLPVLINTSFNLRGEPIVESPFDALHAFSRMPINTMFIEGFIVEKFAEWLPNSGAERAFTPVAR